MNKEAKARIKINDLLKEAGWRFFDDHEGRANIVLTRSHSEKVIRSCYEHFLVTSVDTENRTVDAIQGVRLRDPARIVACIERERAIVEGNRELIKIYEEKIKKVIERVWAG